MRFILIPPLGLALALLPGPALLAGAAEQKRSDAKGEKTQLAGSPTLRAPWTRSALASTPDGHLLFY
jgi:hypothetical protein